MNVPMNLEESLRLRERSMMCAAFGGLLSEILGVGALRDHEDLRERVQQAVLDHEESLSRD